MFIFDRIRQLDDWLIDSVFQPLAWRIEYYTGKNNFWLGRMAMVLWPTSVFSLFWSSNGLWILVIIVNLGFSAVIFLMSLHEEKEFKSGFCNRARETRRPLRLVWGIFAFSFLIGSATKTEILISLGAAGMLIFHYFHACSPMPPHWKEERDKAKEVRARLQTT